MFLEGEMVFCLYGCAYPEKPLPYPNKDNYPFKYFLSCIVDYKNSYY